MAMNEESRGPMAWHAVLAGAAAGGMGWGIRGQYGHETGAMMAGLLVALAVCRVLATGMDPRVVARAVAWCAIATGIGGSMTYGQTVGLTHDPTQVGRWPVLAWGMLGLAIKGGIWTGFGATFLGMGLGGVRYRARDLAMAWAGLLGLCALGIWLFNEPFDPARRVLPRIYFSADWRWLPDAALKPRREVWGGLMLALAGLMAWTGWVRRDGMAWRLGLWGVAGGAIGFPLGQSIQAFHAWNLPLFADGLGARVASVTNWWNFMETTFGATWGGMVGWGLWRMRGCFAALKPEPPGESMGVGDAIPGWAEGAALTLHLVLMVAEEFTDARWASEAYDFGMLLAFLPLACVAGGRRWAWWVMFPVILVPVAGKTFRNMVVEGGMMGPAAGALVLLALPLVASAGMGEWLRHKAEAPGARAGSWLGTGLLFVASLYFGLNFAFFGFPWPWATWTARTPNALVFAGCLGVLAWIARRRDGRDAPG